MFHVMLVVYSPTDENDLYKRRITDFGITAQIWLPAPFMIPLCLGFFIFAVGTSHISGCCCECTVTRSRCSLNTLRLLGWYHCDSAEVLSLPPEHPRADFRECAVIIISSLKPKCQPELFPCCLIKLAKSLFSKESLVDLRGGGGGMNDTAEGLRPLRSPRPQSGDPPQSIQSRLALS